MRQNVLACTSQEDVSAEMNRRVVASCAQADSVVYYLGARYPGRRVDDTGDPVRRTLLGAAPSYTLLERLQRVRPSNPSARCPPCRPARRLPLYQAVMKPCLDNTRKYPSHVPLVQLLTPEQHFLKLTN